MFYSSLREYDITNGEGIRVSLFVSGCSLKCKGCFNKEAWNPCFGKEFTEETLEELIEFSKKDYIKGLSILGGDPFEEYNQETVLKIIKKFRETFKEEKDIWLWTGRKIENLKSPLEREILENIDFLVDGPFIETLKDFKLKFRGSSNQRIIQVKKLNLQNLIEKK